MKIRIMTICGLISLWLGHFPAWAQENASQHAVEQSLESSSAVLDCFSERCERRTRKAEKRFARYEREMAKDSKNPDLTGPTDSISGRHAHPSLNQESLNQESLNQESLNQESLNQESLNQESLNQESLNTRGLGKEPLLDSLRLADGFRQYTADPASRHPSPVTGSIARAQQQLDITQRTKDELMQRKEYWKARAKEHPEYGKWLGRMEKERYYYTAQVNEYRKVLRDPATLDDKLMNALRSDPRFSDFIATLPAKPQDPARMQPRQLVQQMMQSQAAAIDPDPTGLIKDARQKGSELLGDLSEKATELGNLDNAAQVPKFTPNPYKTKSFWERIDVGFDLQFDNRTRFYPASGVAGAQASFNFNARFSMGVLANYRFGMGEIKRIRFSHAGAGYGAFANYKVWKGLGVQAGYERNRRAKMEINEMQHPAAWTSSALAGLTWEYSIGKNLKGTVGVFFDYLYKKHVPETNAVMWRMGWKM